MKPNKYPQDQNAPNASRPVPVANLNQNAADFPHSPDEIARRAYFCYVNQGSKPGRDVQHWLEAEAELLAERNMTRTHGFHNRT